MTMEDESTGGTGIINWLTRLTRKATSGKIVPMHYGEQLPPAVADCVRDARSLWIILLSDSRFDIDGMFANCESRKVTTPLPAHNKRRIMFPCPLHNTLDSESQADVIRRSKLAQSWGMEVKWVDHKALESMIIINPPTRDIGNFDDGIAFIDLSLPHLDTAARAKFEITQKDQAKLFSDLVKSFSQTWGKAHEPSFEIEKHERTKIVLKGVFVA
jgi:hypothetical protein